MAMAGEIPQRCLYEILGVERNSTAEEIRGAYKKLALKFHPDKVKREGRSEEEAKATARFQELQCAYEVLSDPRERSWYDSHRSQILFSSSSSSSAKYSDSEINLWPYFSTCAYSGYGDKGKGFYKVYGDLFQKLFEEEIAFAHAMEMEAGNVQEAPLFGNLESPYAQVSAFYNYWLGFSTVKDFSWVDQYRISEGPNRKVRRLMEDENKKLRKKAKREYNEMVRTLAQFVKKRDKRVVEKQLEKKKLQQEQEQLANLRRQQLQMDKLEKARRFREEEWTKVDSDLPEDDDYNDDDDWYGNKDKETGINQEFYCIVCSKKFKSDKQWKNHEQSKKHKDKVMELRDSFAEEDSFFDEIGLDSNDELVDDHGLNVEAQLDGITAHLDDLSIGATGEEDFEINDKSTSAENRGGRDFCPSSKIEAQENSCTDDNSDASNGIVGDKNASNEETNSSDGEHESDDNQIDDEDSMLAAMLKAHRRKKRSSKVIITEEHNINRNDDKIAEEPMSEKSTGLQPKSSSQQDTDDGNGHDVGLASRPAQWQGSGKAAKGKGKQAAGGMKHPVLGIAEDMRSRLEEKGNVQQQAEQSDVKGNVQQQAEQSDFNKVMLNIDKEERLKNPAKRSIDRRSATQSTFAKNASSKGNKQSKGKKGKGVAKLAGHTCETCGEGFDSRNQLFSHLQGTGHSILKAR